MPINNSTITNKNNEMLFELAEQFGSAEFAKTFVKVYGKFRTTGATLLQWRVLKNLFSDVFTEENKDAWRSILVAMQKTCISFAAPDGAISFLWNGDVVADNGDYEGWVIEG